MNIKPENWQLHNIDNLEESAWQALKYTGNSSIIAGPGAGKTELLAQKAAYLLETNSCPFNSKILAISFKTDAAKNLEERVKKRSPEYAYRFISMTFDAFTKSILDRFRKALPSELCPRSDYQIFFGKLPVSNEEIGTYKLAHSEANTAIESWIAWQIQDSKLQFPLINRLAEYIVRNNIYVKRALRQTYPFIFVDEFQDTTYLQYDFLISVFKEPNISVSVVGDPQQRIMGWAGATENAFLEFERDFSAQRFILNFNYRSKPELQDIQKVISHALYDKINSVINTSLPTNYDINPRSEIWFHANREAEKKYLAESIRKRIQDGLQPSDIAILVKQKVNDYVSMLSSVFTPYGLKVRDLDERFGELSLENLLKEEVIRIYLAFMKYLKADKKYKNWPEIRSYYFYIKNIDEENYIEIGRAETELYDFIKSQKQVNNYSLLLENLLKFLSITRISNAYSRYADENLLMLSIQSLKLFLKKCRNNSDCWTSFFEEIEGVHHIPIMTIHKSKGLEFDTIFLLGFDDTNWWSFKNNPQESLSTLFVAISRAKNYLYFSFCLERGQLDLVKPFYDLLINRAKVSYIDMTS